MTINSHAGSLAVSLADDGRKSTPEQMDAALQTVKQQSSAWKTLPLATKIKLLTQIITTTARIAPRWVEASLVAKGLRPQDTAAYEEWAAGIWPLFPTLRQLHQALTDLQHGQHPHLPGPITNRPDGQVVAQVFPYHLADRLFFPGITGETWMQPEVTPQALASTQAIAYHDHTKGGKVVLVLSAGNVASIAPLDVLYKMFVENHVVLLKTNPVNDYLGPLLEEAFQPLIATGFLQVVYGGAQEGAYLCNHPNIDEIHITGSDKTFDTIVFGPGPQGTQRKAAKQPLLQKRITGELGNVSPVIIVPGPWTSRDIAYQAEHIVTSLINNAGFNCNASRVIIQHREWSQRAQLLRTISTTLARRPLRKAYYPGTQQRYQAFLRAHPEAETYGTATEDQIPWTFITNVDAQQSDDICFQTEAFCGLCAETALSSTTIAAYLDQAVEFANQHLWGTLNVTIIVHPRTLADPTVATALERALTNLRYGTVALNCWAGIGFALGTTTWGAYPGHSLFDIQSGNDVVHNTLMFSQVQKTVLRAPFRGFIKPFWFFSRGKLAQIFVPLMIKLYALPYQVRRHNSQANRQK
ncbi:MAG TPA: aldehyde dehydrogenase family protein [Dictyobacter sp.]|nr:aldehyde dehydrogenase family protein [Dictyobacter sp.]